MRQALYMLSLLTDDDVDWLIAHGASRRAARGDVIVREGAPTEGLFVLLEGQIGLVRGGVRVATAAPGEMLGELSFVERGPAHASAFATRSSLLLEVPQEALRKQLDADAAFASRFFRAVAACLAEQVRTSQRHEDGADGEGTLDPEVLDALSHAGDRFERIRERIAASTTGQMRGAIR